MSVRYKEYHVSLNVTLNRTCSYCGYQWFSKCEAFGSCSDLYLGAKTAADSASSQANQQVKGFDRNKEILCPKCEHFSQNAMAIHFPTGLGRGLLAKYWSNGRNDCYLGTAITILSIVLFFVWRAMRSSEYPEFRPSILIFSILFFIFGMYCLSGFVRAQCWGRVVTNIITSASEEYLRSLAVRFYKKNKCSLGTSFWLSWGPWFVRTCIKDHSADAETKPKPVSTTKASDRPEPSVTYSIAHGGKQDLFPILLDAICCAMCADKKVTAKEREAVHIVLGKTKAPWIKEDIDKRIDGFLERSKKEGMEKIVQATCERIPEFKKRGKEKVLLVCLDYMVRADGIVDEKEKQLIKKFKSSIGIESADSSLQKQDQKRIAQTSLSLPTGEVSAKPKTPYIGMAETELLQALGEPSEKVKGGRACVLDTQNWSESEYLERYNENEVGIEVWIWMKDEGSYFITLDKQTHQVRRVRFEKPRVK